VTVLWQAARGAESTLGRLIPDVLNDLAHLIDPAIRGTINLKNIHGASIHYLHTVATLIAGLRSRALLTIEGLGDDPSRRGLPHTPDTGEQIAVGDPVGQDGICEDSRNMPLTHDIPEVLGTPLPR